LTRCGKIQKLKKTLSKLQKIEKAELTGRNQNPYKALKKKLKEYKFNRIRIILQKLGQRCSEQIVVESLRDRATNLIKTFKNKFKQHVWCELKKIRLLLKDLT
jgi:hypothetical protein